MFNLAIIGLGKWGQTLVKSVQNKSKITKFTSVVSRNPEKISKISKQLNLKTFKTMEDAIKNSKVDGIVMCTPHSTHEKDIINLTKFKKPIFVEKPLALNYLSAKKIINACKKKKIILAVGHNRRFLNTYNFLKKIINNKKFGKITHLEGSFSGKSSFKGSEKSWRNTIKETPLGGMTGKGIHITDLMINLTGSFKKIISRSKNQLGNTNLDDTTDLLIEFKNGATGYLSTILATVKYWEIKVFGSNGWIKIEDEKKLSYKIGDNEVKRPNIKFEDIEKLELEAFAKSSIYKTKFPVDLKEVLENTRLFEEAVRLKNKF